MAVISKNRKLPLAIALLTLVGVNFVGLRQAHAVTYMTHAQVIQYNMVAAGTSQIAIAFTAGAADSAGSLTMAFSSWGTVPASPGVSTTGCQALTGATNTLPGTLTAAGSGSTVTIGSVGALTSGQSYCVVVGTTTPLTNPSAGAYTATLTDGTDTATAGLNVISGDTVTVSATVPPTFTMSLSGSSDALGNLSSSGLTTSTGVTATVSTNGNYGWALWALDSNAGLRSTSQSKTIASVATGSNSNMSSLTNTEAYALGVTTGNASANYADAGGTTGGGLSSSTYNKIASANAAASGATAQIKELADISATTPAASDYSDTITIVGAGSF